MNEKELIRLSLKLASVYIIVRALLYGLSMLSFVGSFRSPSNELLIPVLIVTLLMFGIGLFLFFSKKVGSSKQLGGSKDFLIAGVVISGLVIMALAISDLPATIRLIAVDQSTLRALSEFSHLTGSNLANLTGVLLQFLFGLMLFLRAKFFVNWIK